MQDIEQTKEIVKSPLDAETLISQAIHQNVPVETMERLLAMRRELKAEFAKEAFDKALAKFQSVCPVIEKTKQVSSKDGKPRYKYAPLEAIVEQVKDVLKNNGFSYSIDAEVKESSVKAIVKAVHELGHSVESSFEVPIDPDAYMNAPQRFASALTFAKRYAFCNAFGILTGDEDDDSLANGEQVTEVQSTRKGSWGDKPSDKQLGLISKLMRDKGITIEDIIDAGFDYDNLTGGKQGTASELIDYLLKAKSKVVNGQVVTDEEAQMYM